MCAVTAALVAGVVVAAGASAYAASEQASAQEDANAQNAQNARDTNLANLQMFHENRGSTGSALMPIYAKDVDGNKVEPQLFADTLAAYDAASGGLTPEQNKARYQAILNKYSEAQQGADATAKGVFNGDLTKEAIGDAQPVFDARQQGVATRKEAGLESLQQTLNEIKAIQSKKGFVGDSMADNTMRFNARRQINTAAANDQSQVDLQNASDVAQIKQSGIAARLANLNLPYNMAKQGFTLADSPENAVLDQTARRQQLFNWFKMGQGNFTYNPMPTVQPVASTGQIVAQGVGAVASGVGNYYANQSMASKLNGTGATTAAIKNGMVNPIGGGVNQGVPTTTPYA